MNNRFYDVIIQELSVEGDPHAKTREDISWAIASVVAMAELYGDEELTRAYADETIKQELERHKWNESIAKNYDEFITSLFAQGIDSEEGKVSWGIERTSDAETIAQVSDRICTFLINALEAERDDYEEAIDTIKWAIASVLSTAELWRDAQLIREVAEENLKPVIESVCGLGNSTVEQQYGMFVGDVVRLSCSIKTVGENSQERTAAVNTNLGKAETAGLPDAIKALDEEDDDESLFKCSMWPFDQSSMSDVRKREEADEAQEDMNKGFDKRLKLDIAEAKHSHQPLIGDVGKREGADEVEKEIHKKLKVYTRENEMLLVEKDVGRKTKSGNKENVLNFMKRLLSFKSEEEVAEAVLPELLKYLEEEDIGIRTRAIEALGALGQCAAEAVIPLVKTLGHRDRGVRESAKRTLVKIGPVAVPELKNCLRSKDRDMKKRALLVLGEIGPAAVEAVPSLVKLLDDEDQHITSKAAEALERIGAVAVPELRKFLADPDIGMRMRAAEALSNMGKGAVDAAPDLIKALCHKNFLLSKRVAETLGKIGPAVVAALIKVLGDTDEWARSRAAYVLGTIGPDARDAVPALTEALSDQIPDVRREAVIALGKISNAGGVVQGLIKKAEENKKHPASETKTILAGAKMLRTTSLDINSDRSSHGDDIEKATITSNADFDFLMETVVHSSIEHLGVNGSQIIKMLLSGDIVTEQSVVSVSQSLLESRAKEAVFRLYGIVLLNPKYYGDTLAQAKKLIVMGEEEILERLQGYAKQELASYLSGAKVASEEFYTLMGEAMTAMQCTEYPKAIDKYRSAAQVLERDNPDNISIWKGHLHNNIGVALFTIGEIEGALKHYQESLKARDEAYPNGHLETAITHNNIAKAYVAISKFDDGIKHFNEELRIKRKLGHSAQSLVMAQLNIAALYDVLGKAKEAEAAYNSAEADASDDPEMILHCLFSVLRSRPLSTENIAERKHKAKAQLTQLERGQKNTLELLKLYRLQQRFYVVFESDLGTAVPYMDKAVRLIKENIAILERRPKPESIDLELHGLRAQLTQELLNKGLALISLYQSQRKASLIDEAEEIFLSVQGIAAVPTADLEAKNNIAVCKLVRGADVEAVSICEELLKEHRLKEYPALECSVNKNLSQAHVRLGLKIMPFYDRDVEERSKHIRAAVGCMDAIMRWGLNKDVQYDKALLKMANAEYHGAHEAMQDLSLFMQSIGRYTQQVRDITALAGYCAGKEKFEISALQTSEFAAELRRNREVVLALKPGALEAELIDVARTYAVQFATSTLMQRASRFNLQLNL